MLFKKKVKKFEVVEIHNNGVVITNYLKGSHKDVEKDIEMYKQNSKKYEMVGKNGMVVWA